ncbi:MAG: FadR/GntR family transcriptional regulator [Alphaproteobacteria bacterium]
MANEIAARIMSGEFAPGMVLPNEADFSVKLKVSRTALREAIKVLAAKGLVESRPKIGTRIRPRDHWNMLDPDVLAWQFATGNVALFADDLFEVRQIIEPAAAAMAAERAKDEDIAEIDRAYRDMEAAGDDLDASIEPDLRFHLGILAATGNELLVPLGALIETALASSIKLSGSSPGATFHSLPLHKAVLNAIKRRDASGARLAMRKLLEETIKDIRHMIDEGKRGVGQA